MTRNAVSRRDFLKGAAATAGFMIVPRRVLGGPGYTPPSEELTMAVIGTGGMGHQHLANYRGARLVAICDTDANHVSGALNMIANQKLGEGVRGYRDFREVLARPDVDIVHIVTPPHWHAAMTVLAARAGKDIWCEKPMTRTIGEGEKVVEEVRRAGRMFRINTWWRFREPFFELGTDVRTLKKLVGSGEFGWPLKFTIGKSTGFDWRFDLGVGRTDLVPEPVPSNLDYDMWLGPAPYKPYSPGRVHVMFRGFWDYDGGGLGDIGQHVMDPLQYVMNKDGESPVEIEAEGDQQHPDAVQRWRTVRLRYADGCEIILDGTDEIRKIPFMEGPGGKLYRNLESTLPDLSKVLAACPEPEPQQTDFWDSVRRRVPFTLNEKVAHRSCTLVNLAKIAVRLRRPLRFDPATQRFVNDDQANRMISEPMREPWNLG